MHRDPRPRGMGCVDRLAQRVEVVGRSRRLRHRPVRVPLGGVADDLHPRRPGCHLGLDSRDEFVRRDGGVHAWEIPVRRGKESASGGHDGTPGRRRARESKGGMAAAPDVADHCDTAGGVFRPGARRRTRRPRGTGRARLCRRSGARARRLARPARTGRAVPRCSPVPETTRSPAKPSRNVPEKVHATEERYRSCGTVGHAQVEITARSNV